MCKPQATHFLVGAPLAIGGALHPGLGVTLRAGRIAAVLPDTAAIDAERHLLPDGAILAPGLIDLQVNGGGGVLFNDCPTAAAARAIAVAHGSLGATGILPTLITDTDAKMQHAADAVLALRADPASGVCGLHFEGPFLSPARPGVHRAELIRRPDPALLTLICDLAARLPVLLTLAPECVEDAVLDRLTAAGVVVSAGHSAASAGRAAAAFARGVRGVTHLFNAMPPMSARAPGLAGAALTDRSVFVGVIADGIHVDAAMLRLMLACKPPDRIFLVSDAMPCAGTALTGFVLQERRILRQHGRLTTEDGTLAGADLDLVSAIRRLIALTGVAPALAIAMASEVPAAFLRLADHGRIAPGCHAAFTVFGAGPWVPPGIAGCRFQCVEKLC